MKLNKKYFLFFFIFAVIVGLVFPVLKSFNRKESKDNLVVEKNPLISVIVPVYNTEKYLPECLDSIINQTLKDIEIICVNDGSTDDSLKVLEEYKSKDSRIKIINQENLGISSTRNSGFNACSGKYVHFFDSDDIIVDSLYEIAYKTSENYDAELFKFSSKQYNDGEPANLNKVGYDENKIKFYSHEKGKNPYVEFDGIDCDVICNKIWNREFLIKNNLKFIDNIRMFYEDVIFCWESYLYLNKAVNYDDIFHGYRQRATSIVHSNSSEEKYFNSKIEIALKFMTLKDKYSEFPDGENWLLDKIISLFHNQILNGLDSKEKQIYYSKKLFEIIDKPFLNIITEEIPDYKMEKIEELRKISNLKI